MTTFLLDANVLIALTAAEHVHHRRASRWASEIESFALCPIVEGALVRFAVRLGATPMEARRTLDLVRARPGYQFWPDSLSYADVLMDHVHGHRQVVDAYLVSLVRSRPKAVLATLDQVLVAQFPEQTLLVPGA